MSVNLKVVLMVGVDLYEHDKYKDGNYPIFDENEYDVLDYVGEYYESNTGKVVLFPDNYNGKTLMFGKVLREMRDEDLYSGLFKGVIELGEIDEIKTEIVDKFKELFGYDLLLEHLSLRIHDYYS